MSAPAPAAIQGRRVSILPQQAVAAALDEIRHPPHVTAAADPMDAKGQVSRNGRIAFATVQYGGSTPTKEEASAMVDEALRFLQGGIEALRRG